MLIGKERLYPTGEANELQGIKGNKSGGDKDFRAVLQGQNAETPSGGGFVAPDQELLTVEEITGQGNVQAVSARSRIQVKPEPDVTGFLELVRKTEYLLRGMPVEEVEGCVARQALSGEQRERLRRIYNTDDLPPEQQHGLFRQLASMGVLTSQDVRDTQYTVSPAPGSVMDYLAGEADYRDVAAVPEENPKGRLDVMIHNERFAYQHVKQRYGQHCGQVQQLAESHQKVLEVLNKI